MNFSNALALMDSGFRCTRQDWREKGEDVWVGMVKASQPITIYNMPKAWLESGKDKSRIAFGDWLGVKTTNDIFVPWEAAQVDVFANDWTLYDITVGGAETAPRTQVAEIKPPVTEIKSPVINEIPQTAIGESAPKIEVVNDAEKFVADRLADNRAKKQVEKEKAAMRAKVKAAVNAAVKPAPKPQTTTEREKAIVRERMNKALTKK